MQVILEGHVSKTRKIIAAAAATAGAVTTLLALTTGVASAAPSDPGGQVGHAVGGTDTNGDNPLVGGGGGTGGTGGNAQVGGL
jgi:uncharacterized membrane protein